MTDAELTELLQNCPVLYHTAEAGAWKNIQHNGLMSTSALLDAHGINGEQRFALESKRRMQCTVLSEGATVRDQLPMDDKGLRECLPCHISPQDWYQFLNKKVFFWLTKDRLYRMTNSNNYRLKMLEVLVIDTRALVEAYRDKIWLCPINSGCTKPYPHPRNYETFAKIDDYLHHKRRKSPVPKDDWVVELCVDYAVPDVRRFVRGVFVVQGRKLKETLYRA